MKISTCVYSFFSRYLPKIKGVSPNTVKSYRDTFTLFLPFAAQYLSLKTQSLTMEHLSSNLILDFLENLQTQRKNTSNTRNQRLAALKSFAKMIKLMVPEYGKTAEKILNIPEKSCQKTLIGYMTQEEVMKVFQAVDMKKKEGFRDYTILNLLYNSGARAEEITHLNLDYFRPENKILGILGKGNRYRTVKLWPKTISLLNDYITKHRNKPLPLFHERIFINQRGGQLTRHGINRICRNVLAKALPVKKLNDLEPAHGFRHSCAMNLLQSGYSTTDIKNHLGHENIQSTTVYLKLTLERKRKIQKEFIAYTQAVSSEDPKLNQLIDWENKQDVVAWLDSL